MPQMEPLVLTDRAATPVDHEFNPRGKDKGIATYAESTGIPIGDRRITISDPRFSNGRARVSVKLAWPVVQDNVVGGVSAPTIVRTNYVDLAFNWAQESSLQERDDVVAMIYDLLRRDDNPVFGETAINLEGQY
jgi:hypothetical protein